VYVDLGKGELSPAMMDFRWSYQVALPESETLGARYHNVHNFCRDLSLCPRKHSGSHGGQWWNVFCFAKEDDAKNSRTNSAVKNSIRRKAGRAGTRRAGRVHAESPNGLPDQVRQ
jgi:hypothetical protein